MLLGYVAMKPMERGPLTLVFCQASRDSKFPLRPDGGLASIAHPQASELAIKILFFFRKLFMLTLAIFDKTDTKISTVIGE